MKESAIVSELHYDDSTEAMVTQKGGTAQDAHDMYRLGKQQQLKVRPLNQLHVILTNPSSSETSALSQSLALS
jgi:hypothetical protein